MGVVMMHSLPKLVVEGILQVEEVLVFKKPLGPVPGGCTWENVLGVFVHVLHELAVELFGAVRACVRVCVCVYVYV
ncbi:MAG: hypothetical protein ACK55Z_28110, partial [bacterium]